MGRRKQIPIDDTILSQIEAAAGTQIDPGSVVVYEAAALSTRPLNQIGSIFHGAQVSRETLVEMASALNEGLQSVPLHTLHQQGSEIPVGKLFRARVVDEFDGSSTLLTMFYLPLQESELVNKIDLGVLDEVSVGLKCRQAACSVCGFDFYGEAAHFGHFFSRTCENGHVVGHEGMHLKLNGLDQWMEMSLVSRGASNRPKILSRAQWLQPQTGQDRLAASGMPLAATMLFASTEMEPSEMTEEERAYVQKLEQRLEALEAAGPAEDPVPEIQARLSQALEQIRELEARLQAQDQKIQEVVLPDNFTVGGVAASAISDALPNPAAVSSAAAFKTRRNA